MTRLEYDPFSLDDVIPDEPDSDDEDKDKDELIQDQLDKLMQDNSEGVGPQLINKLKLLGWGSYRWQVVSLLEGIVLMPK